MELQHHGVKGMKWGVRRAFKNKNATTLKHPNDSASDSHRSSMTRRQQKVKAYIDKKIASNNKTIDDYIREDPKCAKRGYDWFVDDLRYANKKLSEIDTSKTSLREAKRIYRYG